MDFRTAVDAQVLREADAYVAPNELTGSEKSLENRSPIQCFTYSKNYSRALSETTCMKRKGKKSSKDANCAK